MIHPLVPYTLRGGIWYQGERNAKTLEGAALYRDLLENMVTQWRKDWNSEFPFYAVQLVNFKAPQTQPVEDTAWAVIRESFLKFHKEVKGAGIAVGIDVGDEKNIHPKDKQTIGLRLAHQALAKTYGRNVVAGGPIYKSMLKEGNAIVISFDDLGSGLEAKGGELKRFAVAGADKKFVEATAVIKGNTVLVSSPEVKNPVAVRYAWADNPTGCNLYNKEGFAASPFRTDDWPFAQP
jgi:sialate O-acetylesterase